ncbi:MAG: alpha/beta hydrolase [Patescibacteria group bacterium]|nr:alpha/beta hydrolase [Patescibacteria group bacterium]
MKQQVIIIHGGDSFASHKEYLSFLRGFKIDFEKYKAGGHDWKRDLYKDLGKNFDVYLPQMPNKTNARYLEWKLWFDKFLPYLKRNVVLIGHSQGGIFLAKYLSENKLPKKIGGVFLIAAPYDEQDADYSLADFKLPKSLAILQSQARKIFLYHSKNDDVVPFANLKKYENSLPDAAIRTFKSRGHFNQATFPELVKDIKQLHVLGSTKETVLYS